MAGIDPFYLTDEWVLPLADAIEAAMLGTWAGETERLIAADPRDMAHLRESYDLETQVRVRQQAEGLARGRLQQYGERLVAFLDGAPSETALADWLSERALTDAGVWARGDSLEVRRDARLDYYRTNRAPEGHYRVVPDSAAEPGCRDIAGRTFGGYDEAESALGSSWHRNCLVGDSLVVAPHLRASFERWFEGEVVVLCTAAGDLLTCTKNHPILTDHGWVAAGLLKQGDHVVRCAVPQCVAGVLDPDHDQVPTRIEQIARALGPAVGASVAVMPTAAEDFHGDGADSDVCIVRTNSRAELVRQTALLQQGGEEAVVFADDRARSLARDGASQQLVFRTSHATDRGVRGGSRVLSLFGAVPGVLDAPCLTPGTFQTGLPQPDVQGTRRAAKPPANVVVAEALRDVQIGEGGDTGMLCEVLTLPAHRQSQVFPVMVEQGSVTMDLSRQLRDRFPGDVTLVQIAEVSVREFAGQVYDLSTLQGWYIAEHIVAHNCVHSVERAD